MLLLAWATFAAVFSSAPPPARGGDIVATTRTVYLGGAYRFPRGYYSFYGPASFGPAFPGPGCYGPAYFGSGSWSWYGPSYYTPGWYPPVVLPAESLYGPQATLRFMGVNTLPRSRVQIIVPPTRWDGDFVQGGVADPQIPAAAAPPLADGQAPAAANPPADPLAAVPQPPAPQPPPAPAAREVLPAPPPQPRLVARPVSEASLSLAWRFIGLGDAAFGEQKYLDASGRYRRACEIAPQLADGWFRQAFALTAMGRYSQAVEMLRRGLALAPGWPQSDFRLTMLYDDNQIAKRTHLESMAKAAEDNPGNGELLFLVGVHLYFDGQPARAQPFFARAAALTPSLQPLVASFPAERAKLPPPPPQPPQ